MSQPADQVERVRRSYNVLSRAYRGDIPDTATLTQYAGRLAWVRSLAPAGGEVLDLGCGNGIPAAKWLTDNGFRVAGVDVSDEMVNRARSLVPAAAFVRADMTNARELDPDPESYDAIVSFYALIHLPIASQRPLIERLATWLRPGGAVVTVVGHTAWQGHEHRWLGSAADMWWSHPDARTYRCWFETAGLQVVHHEFVPEGSSGHALFVARRAAAPAFLAERD